ncbi:MAG TPA: glutamate--tRNA ligase [Candidatus Limnocylindrales bacterium]|nr:glutamate--tRNA ligase [Candidatus Limnocylindrales bacterium]
MKIRTRFAPSPTGHLHIGGARTALFNWLFARKNQGIFLLRIEDTDVERSTLESVQGILDGLKWLGLIWDEGPYYQSQRLELYQHHVQQLLQAGKAYRCYCTPEELEAKRKQALQEGKPLRYDGKCRELKEEPIGKPFAIRFKAPQTGRILIQDLIRGPITYEVTELDDLIIQRSDGMPTYNFCVVVDDVTMEITHVIRGDDHLNNTPRQILLYEAFGYPIPQFAHVPMILGPDKTRLSKRHGATSVLAYREMGYLPQALVNYLVRLGWSYGDQEIFSVPELIEKFSLENVGKAPAVFNPEKLLWLNHHYIKATEPAELARLLIPFLEKKGFKVEEGPWLTRVVQTLQERSKTLVEMADRAEFYFQETIPYQEKVVQKFFRKETVEALQELIRDLEQLESFEEKELEKIFRNIIDRKGLKLADIAQPVRIALTGGTASPGLFEIMAILGKERVLKRIKQVIEFFYSHLNR